MLGMVSTIELTFNFVFVFLKLCWKCYYFNYLITFNLLNYFDRFILCNSLKILN